MMKLVSATLIAAALAFLPSDAFTAEKKMKKDAPASAAESTSAAAEQPSNVEQKRTGRPIPYQGVVHTVDQKSGKFTFKTKEGKIHTFNVKDSTVITKDEQPASLEDVKPGEIVRGTRYRAGENEWDANKVMIGAKKKG